MAEITSTIKFYLHTGLHKEKNFIISSFETYLSQFLDVEKTKYQYVKHQMNLSYKMDISQDKLEMINANDIDYVSIKNSNESKTYFYFVINKVWKSTLTIEYELEMDTLNTFGWNSDYIVSKKTFVRREHKDRLKIGDMIPITTPTSNEMLTLIYDFGGGATLPTIEIGKFYINPLDYNELSYAVIGCTSTSLSDNVYEVAVYDEHYNLVNTFSAMTITIQNGLIKIKPTTSLPVVSFSLLDGSISHIVLTLTGKTGISGQSFSGDYQTFFALTFTNFNYFYKRIIDKFPENINPVLYKKSDELLLDDDGTNNWYLIYANENAVESSDNDYSPLYVNPVKLMFARDTTYEVATRTAVQRTIYPSEIPNVPNFGECLDVFNESGIDNGAYVEIFGVQYTITGNNGDSNYNLMKAFKYYANDNVWRVVKLIKLDVNGNVSSVVQLTDVPSITFYGIGFGFLSNFLSFQVSGRILPDRGTLFDIGTSAQGSSYTSSNYEELDTTLSKLIKVIALPYAPLGFLEGISTIYSLPMELSWNGDFDYLQVAPNKRIALDYEINFGNITPFSDLWVYGVYSSFAKKTRNDELESKFYNSEFTQNKFVYDSFSFTFQLETMDVDEFINQPNYDKFLVEYIVSKKLSSKFVFKFNQYVCGEYEKQDYNNILIVDRNNEIPLFTNAYVNYMRTGYQFDVSNKKNQEIGRWGGIALSTIGAVASFIGGAVSGNAIGIVGGIGLTTSTISQIIGAITTQNQQENAISQKQLQASMQSESVQGSDDVELFKQYGQNKARLMKYQPSEVMSKMIKDLFYYGGYATSEYKVPDVYSRIYFNYLQCDLVVDGTSNIPDDILNDIINKFQNGCTFFHRYSGEWDIGQQYENFESSLD